MNIKRYWRLFKSFFRFSLMAETEFRANLIFWSLDNLLWFFLGIAGVELIFGQVNSIAGWNKPEVYLVLFISSLFHDLSWTLLFRNFGAFSHLIRYGGLDYHLLLPVNTRFLLSFRILEFDHYIRMALLIFLIHRYTVIVLGSFPLLNVIVALFLFICGFAIFYSIFFMVTLTNIWFTNLANLVEFLHNIKDFGAKPVYIFQKGLLVFFTFVLPVGFIATFPAEALIGRFDMVKLVAAPLLAVLFWVLSNRFFRFALKHYSSASR